MPRRPRLPIQFLCGLLVVATSSGAHPRDDEPRVVPSDPVFEALLIDGTSALGRVGDLSLEAGRGRLVLVDEDDMGREIDLARLVKLTRRGEPPPYPPEGSLLVLPEGDRLRAIIDRADQAEIEVLPHVTGDQNITAPLDRILGIVLAPPPEPGAPEVLIEKLRRDPRDGEVLWQVNGDRPTGTFLGLDAKAIAFDSGRGPADIARASVVALGFDPTLIAYPPTESVIAELTLTDGSRLGATAYRMERGRLVAETRLGPTLRIPIGTLSRVHIRGGSVAYLAERQPARAVYVPYLDRHPETFGRDATWDGRHLKLGGLPYDRGLGMLPRTLAAYVLEPGDARFQALVGLDDRAGDQASVVFRVLVDRREAFVSPSMTRDSEPIAVDVDLKGGRALILVVEFGERGDVQDSADWIEARIIRE